MLTSDFRKSLATKAHSLPPIVRIGQKGLTENVHKEIDQSLLAHELIKIKVIGSNAEERKLMVDSIIDKHHASLIQMIGHVAVLYRHNPDKKA
tara:strand:- start:79 stop:357 length:279 start_codon:yes stop_codon:yes gene_type:complete